MELTTHAATSNLLKNRYRNILTCKVVFSQDSPFFIDFLDDHARVVLKPLPETEPLECDYIAAAYVDVRVALIFQLNETYIHAIGSSHSKEIHCFAR